MVTDFPKEGDNKEVTIRNSNHPQFPDYDYVADLKENYPDIWDKGGNIRGEEAFNYWTKYRNSNMTQGVIDWIKEREAWAERHKKNYRLAGVIAQLKWGVVGSRGVSHMKEVVNEEKQKQDNKKTIKRLLMKRLKTFMSKRERDAIGEELAQSIDALYRGHRAGVDGVIIYERGTEESPAYILNLSIRYNALTEGQTWTIAENQEERILDAIADWVKDNNLRAVRELEYEVWDARKVTYELYLEPAKTKGLLIKSVQKKVSERLASDTVDDIFDDISEYVASVDNVEMSIIPGTRGDITTYKVIADIEGYDTSLLLYEHDEGSLYFRGIVETHLQRNDFSLSIFEISRVTGDGISGRLEFWFTGSNLKSFSGFRRSSKNTDWNGERFSDYL